MIGWDAADRTAVEGWMQDGTLPHLRALRERGLTGRLVGFPGLSDDACWASFATGVEPGVHGRFHHRQILPGTYRLGNYFRDKMGGEAFWSVLARAGRRVAVLDVPKSPLAAEPLNGIQLADWMPHGEDGHVPVGTPPAVAELPERFRVPPSISCHELRTTIEGFAELAARVDADLERRTALALDWLGRERWDCFLGVFAESHCIGHHCWHLHDESHAAHDPAVRRALGDPVIAVHRSLDAALGRIMAACDPETVVMVFSLAGMGANHVGSSALVDAVLRRLDARTGGPLASLRRVVARLRAPRDPHPNALAVEGRRAFAVHSNAIAAAVRVNLVGREPRGVVAREAYDAFCAFLATSFRDLVDPTTGRRLVAEVVPVTARYRGPRADAYADLLVVWNGEAPITAAASDAIGVIAVEPGLEPPGNHCSGGWFVAAGPGVPSGEAPPAGIVDVAPTAAAVLGVELPTGGVPIFT